MSKHKISDFLENYGDGIHGTPNYDENGTVYFINGNNLVNGKIQINANTLKITEEEANKIKRDLNEKTLQSRKDHIRKKRMFSKCKRRKR